MNRQLDDQDKTKLHMEIMQLSQQRFLLCTAAVTLVAIVSSKLIPDNLDAIVPADIKRACIVSLMVVVVLSMLFMQSYLIWQLLRTYTSYLISTESSKWEADWKAFRNDYSALAKYDTTGHTYIFLGLGLLCSLYPVVLALVGGGFRPLPWLAACLIGGFAYTYVVLRCNWNIWSYSEKEIEKRWEEVLKKDRV